MSNYTIFLCITSGFIWGAGYEETHGEYFWTRMGLSVVGMIIQSIAWQIKL
jgi:hypothetical protein